jgi:hypothetical protein
MYETMLFPTQKHAIFLTRFRAAASGLTTVAILSTVFNQKYLVSLLIHA